ncbi:diacylglycerol kinase [Lentibacillus kapialis]|uniref:Diacylglycerol kinase n=1 Tax=Lentibacillus kapialis TaxID=340214 RepID=A0A917UT79_9BACI|nr:diacylglycerol kinase family protein [Lentibacillus kapialis]GGJ83332.1 diacylglycerol kinase [Lentibacillus kapialis]
MSLVLSDKRKGSLFGFSHAWDGLKAVVRTEMNFRIHLITAFLVMLAGLFFRLTAVEWIMIFFAIGLVLIAEMLNTAIEKTLDYLKPDLHPQAKLIKDLSAGAVLISALVATVVGLLVFLPEFL